VHTSTTNTIIKTGGRVFVSLVAIAAGILLGTRFPNVLNTLIPSNRISKSWVSQAENDTLKLEYSALVAENEKLTRDLLSLTEENKALKLQLTEKGVVTPPLPILGINYLPDKLWLEIDTPVDIFDKKVTIKILKIYEHRTRAPALSMQVNVPMRSTYKKARLFKGQTIEFTYMDQKYILTVNDIKLQNQKAQVSVRET
jgi:hypothetical protein